jgi:hypothetical protein
MVSRKREISVEGEYASVKIWLKDREPSRDGDELKGDQSRRLRERLSRWRWKG